ncbi:hypothetical protein Tco_0409225 [Tanacetum coccineum]
MSTLKFADTHNMITFLSKPTESDGFEQIVDFLNAHPIKYALTVNPTIYTSCIEQFWSTIKVKTINGESQLHALVDGKKIIITGTSVRRDLQLADENDEAVHKELGDNLVRTATTASSLEVEQDSGNINKTHPCKPNESGSLGTTSCGGPRVLDLEKTKTTQHNEIANLKRRVKKLEKKNRSRTHKLKILYKVGLIVMVESSNNKEILGEDASKQGRIDAIDADDEITLVSVQNVDEEMFDVNVLDGEEVFFAEQEVAVKDVSNVVSTTGDATTVNAATTTTATITTVVDITLCSPHLMEIKSTKPKEKRVVIQELGESTTKISLQQSLQQSQDKCKGILIEPTKPMKKKDLTRLDEETALKLPDEFDEEERLAR